MKRVIILFFFAIGILAHHNHKNEHQPLITRDHLEELRTKVTFEIFDYEDHPFKNWSKEDLIKILGLLRKEETVSREIFYGDNGDLPDAFDARVEWPSCIHEIRDQQHCGSCWAFSASEVLSDRFCIATNSKINVVLSPQDLVSCDTQEYGCRGGFISKSWDYIRDTGIVSEDCLPYTSGGGEIGECPFQEATGKCKIGTFRKYKVSSHNQHSTIAEAKKSIINEGPIESGFDVYDDFLSYKAGVYRRQSNRFLGGHAVKVIGWGKNSDGTEYWIVANSWNTRWGENGFFRIAFGECNFEIQLWSGIPDIKIINHLFLS